MSNNEQANVSFAPDGTKQTQSLQRIVSLVAVSNGKQCSITIVDPPDEIAMLFKAGNDYELTVT